MNVSQLDQMKQAYEQSIYTVDLLVQCVDAMKEVETLSVVFRF